MPLYNFETPQQLRDVIYSFQISKIILTAYELDVFSLIDPKGSLSNQIAERLETDKRATDRLMNALCAIGLLQKKDGYFFNTAFSEKYLSKTSHDYIKGFAHTTGMWETWSEMTKVIKSGKAQKVRIKESQNKEWAEAFIGSMHERAMQQADDVAKKINIENYKNILDIGGGSGAYSIVFAKKNPNLVATVFDLPHIISLTLKYVKESGLIERFNFIGGDYLIDDFGKGYDMAFLSAIIHINSPVQNKNLIKKCYESLLPGGVIVIQDHVMDADRTKPYAGALFAINMLVATECGDTYTENEIISWLENAGFKKINRKDTQVNALMIGTK